MLVRVRGIEIVCDNLDELDAILDRYGDGAAVRSGGGATPTQGGGKSVDERLLRAFMGSPSGVPSPTITGLLKVNGKAIPAALAAWAGRMNLPNAFEKANPGGRRGWKLTDAAMAAARAVHTDE